MTQEGMENMTQEEEDNVLVYIRKSKEEMYELFQQKCGNDIVLDLDSYNISNLRHFLIEVENRVTLIKDHIVDVSLLHNIDENEMIPGIFIQIGGEMIELFVSANKLYMHGFRVRGTTYEAIEDHRRLRGSESLGFGVSYQELEMNPITFKFGWYSIRKAAHIFRKFPHGLTPVDYVSLKHAFSTIIVMILESLRFHEVRREVLQYYENNEDRTWPKLRKIIKDWKKSYKDYHMWRRAKEKLEYGFNTANNQFIIDHFPTMISTSGLAMSPSPPPLSEDDFNDYAYDKEVATRVRELMIRLEV